MADKINPDMFQNYEVKELAKQVAEQIRFLWGAKKEMSERVETLEADLERRIGNRVVDERHTRVCKVLQFMEDQGIGKEFFVDKTTINAGTTVLAYATVSQVELNDDPGTRSIITSEIKKRYNLDRDSKSGRFCE